MRALKHEKLYKSHGGIALISFAVTALLLAAAYAYAGMAPFGDRTAAFCDGSIQYLSFMGYMRDVLLGKQNVFYAMEKTVGGNIVGVLAYYTMSPFNILLPLFPIEKLPLAENIIVLLKLSTCALTMSLLLTDILGDDLRAVLFAAAYAFCGYCMEYFWCFMWLDGVILLPVVALGLRYIISGRTAALYALALGLAIISNYYIGYMLCIFSVLYYLYLAYASEKTPKELIFPTARFCAYSLLAGGVSAFILLPTVFAMQGGKRGAFIPLFKWYTYSISVQVLEWLLPGRENYDSAVKYVLLAAIIIAGIAILLLLWVFCSKKSTEKRRIIALLAAAGIFVIYGALFEKAEPFLQKFIVAFTTQADMYYGRPGIYSGILVFALTLAYFMSDEIKSRRKTAALAFLLVMFISLRFYIPNLVWHGFTENSGFNYRYAFIISFFICSLAAEFSSKKMSLDIKQCIIIIAIGVIILLLGKENLERAEIRQSVILGIVELSIICVCLYLLGRDYPSSVKKCFAAVILTLHILSLAQPAARNISELTDESAHYALTYQSKFEETAVSSKLESDVLKKVDDGFYRASINYSGNAPMLYDFKGIAHFSSAEATDVVDFMQKTGIFTCVGVWSSASAGRTHAFESFFGMRYFDTDYNGLYPAIEGVEVPLYENPYALSIAFTAEPAVLETYVGTNPFENFNKMFKSAAGENEDIFAAVETELLGAEETSDGAVLRYLIKNTDYNELYLYFENWNDHVCGFSLDGGPISICDNISSWVIRSLGSLEPETSVLEIHCRADEADFFNDNLLLYSENLEVLSKYHDILSADECHVENIDDAKINVTVNTDKDKLLVLTVPQDDSWNVRVDGKDTATEKAYGLFMAIPLTAGEHEVEMNYMPKGLIPGTAVSVVSLALIAAVEIIKKKKKA